MRVMIYCVEDDRNILELLVYTLRATGYEAEGFGDGGSFFNAISVNVPKLIILDIMLPDKDGLQILRQLKNEERTKEIPVIMVTAKNTEFDKVNGLESGADDYVTKPIAMMEFLARVKAVLRRSERPKALQQILTHDKITLNTGKHQVLVDDREVTLTYKEFELLRHLLENKGIAFTREKLLETIWEYGYEGGTRTVDVHIRSLRQKLEPYDNCIVTIRGIGYKIDE